MATLKCLVSVVSSSISVNSLIMLLDVLLTARSMNLIASLATSHSHVCKHTHTNTHFLFCASLSFVSTERWSSVKGRDDKCVREEWHIETIEECRWAS